MDDPVKISLLKDEYLLLQKFYEDFDSRMITIKGWSASIAIAAIGAGFFNSPYLWLFASGASLIFWCLEALWKSFQYMYGPRIQEIEEAFSSDDFSEISPLQIYSSWFDVFQETGFAVFSSMRLGIVAFPHAVTFITGITLFCAYALDLLPPLSPITPRG